MTAPNIPAAPPAPPVYKPKPALRQNGIPLKHTTIPGTTGPLNEKTLKKARQKLAHRDTVKINGRLVPNPVPTAPKPWWQFWKKAPSAPTTPQTGAGVADDAGKGLLHSIQKNPKIAAGIATGAVAVTALAAGLSASGNSDCDY